MNDHCNRDYPNILQKSELIKQIHNARMELAEKIINVFSALKNKQKKEYICKLFLLKKKINGVAESY
jgi:hypothetical protein